MCSLILQLWPIVDELVKDLLVSQEVLIELLVCALEVMSLLNLVVDCHLFVLVIEHLESKWVAQAGKINILMVRSPISDLGRVPMWSLRMNVCPMALVHTTGA